MNKRLLSLLLSLALLLCAASGLGETSALSAAQINSLQSLTGENGALWQEGTAPSQSMNAFQMWQWVDWFLNNQVRSLLGSIKSLEQLEPGKPLDAQAQSDQWKLRELESTLSGFEEQLEEDRLAITNGIRILQSGATDDAGRESVLSRISEAEDEIRQIIGFISANYSGFVSLVDSCTGNLQAQYGGYAQGVHNAALAGLASEAAKLESSESKGKPYTVSVLSTQQVGIRVLDAANRPIQNATVTLTNALTRFVQGRVTTDAQGEAVFWADELGADENGELKLSLRVEAAGYRTSEVQTLRLRSGETRTVSLQADDGSPYLIMGSLNGRDVLSESNTYYYSAQNTAKMAFTVKLSCGQDGELELRYPVDAGATEFATVVKAFAAADSGRVIAFEDQWLSKLHPDAEVFFTIRAGGKEYTTAANLVIQPAMVEAPVLSGDALFSFPGGMSTTLPGDASFVGGSRLSLDIPVNLPGALYLPSHTALYALGYDFRAEQAGWQTRDAEDEARAIKAFELRGKADEALAAAGARRDVNATVQSPMLDSSEAYVTPFAKLAGLYRAYDQSLSLSGAAGATVAFRSDITKTFADAVYTRLSGIASANLSMGEGFGMDVASEAALDMTGGVPAVVGKPKTSFGTTVSLGMNLRSTSGLGVRESVLAALRSYGSVNATANPAAASLTASAGISTDISLRELFLASNGKGQSAQRDYTGAREPHTPNPPISATGSKGLEPLETEVLFTQMDSAAGEIQIVQIGGDRYTFWIQPAPNDGEYWRVKWCNLDGTRNGQVSYLVGDQSTAKRERSDDYAFAVESCGEYCALTILSGKFSRGTSFMTPSKPVVATVLMKRNDTSNSGNLDMVGYWEDWLDGSDDYPVMPQVRLLMNGEDATILSAYTTDANAQQITGSLFRRTDDASKNGKYLEKISELTRADSAQITRYSTATQQGTFYTLNAAGELSRMTGSGPQVLAQGEIVSFKVLRGASVDRLFYLERVATQTGGYAYRLRSVTSDGAQKTDYGVDAGATLLDLASVDGGVYLYWREYAEADAGAACLVRCVRYDPGTDTVSSPFSLMELPADTCSVKLMDGDAYEGYYSVDKKNSTGSYLRQSLSRFTYGPVVSAELTAAVLTDPCVSAGDFAELAFSVKNTGNVPLSEFDVRITDAQTGEEQTLHLDLHNPLNNTSSVAGYTMTGGYAVRRISSLYDPLNHDVLNIIQTTPGGDITCNLRTGLLMPGDTYSYQARIQIPADWAGASTLTAQVTNAEGNLLTTFGMSQNASVPAYRLGSAAAGIDTDAHDLMLSAQLFTRNDEDYVHITIRNRSGNTASSVTPVLTASSRGEALPFSHTLRNPLGDGFGYSMDIPLQTLTGGKTLSELELHVSGAADAEFADSDNHVRLMLTVLLSIVGQPEDIDALVGQDVAFSALASGGQKPYRYQWQRMTGKDQWKDIPGETKETYTIGSVRNDQNGLTVRCVISDQLGDTVTSDPAALNVRPNIIEQPQDILASLGEKVAFSVAVSGGQAPYSYQWQRVSEANQWEDIPGATRESYGIDPVENGHDDLTVRCVISDQRQESIASEPATLNVRLNIIEQPASLPVLEGQKASFSVGVTGGKKPYRYQWQRMTGKDQWKDIPGETKETYTIGSVRNDQNGLTVRCVVSDQLGDTVTSEPAALTVRLNIIEQPQDILASLGEKVAFSVAVSGGQAPYSYQWQRVSEANQWEDIPGATRESYGIDPVENGHDDLTVRCVISDQRQESIASEPATLTVRLNIIEQPASLPVLEGQKASFSVGVTGGKKPYSYQWQRMTGKDQWKDIPGETKETYTIGSVRNDQNGLTVRCVVSDQLGDTVTSDSAMLSILPQTGDSSQLTLWLLLAFSSVAALVVLLRKRCSR